MSGAVEGLLEEQIRRLPDDELVPHGPEWQDPEDAVTAVRRLESMLRHHPPAQVLAAVEIAHRLLRECRSPAAAAERLRVWRSERLHDPRRLTDAEREALSVAATIAGVDPGGEP